MREVLRSGAEEHIDGEAQGIGHAEGAGGVAITGSVASTRAVELMNTVSAKNISLDRKPFINGTPAIEALATMAVVAVYGTADQPAEAADVTGAAFVVDDAGGHEQRGLEGGVVENVEHRGDGSQRAVQAQQQGNQAQVADGRVRQQALEVVLEHGGEGAEQQGEGAGTADDPEPLLATRQHRP